MTPELVNILMQFGGLGVLALFSYLLLQSVLKQNQKITNILDNHLRALQEQTKVISNILTSLSKDLEKHSQETEKREGEILAKIEKLKNGGG